MKGNRPAPGRGDQDPAKPPAPHSGASHWQAHALGASWVLPLSLPRAFQEPPPPSSPRGACSPSLALGAHFRRRCSHITASWEGGLKSSLRPRGHPFLEGPGTSDGLSLTQSLGTCPSDPNCTVPCLPSLTGDRTRRRGSVSLRCPQLPVRCAPGSQSPCTQRAQCPLLGRPPVEGLRAPTGVPLPVSRRCAPRLTRRAPGRLAPGPGGGGGGQRCEQRQQHGGRRGCGRRDVALGPGAGAQRTRAPAPHEWSRVTARRQDRRGWGRTDRRSPSPDRPAPRAGCAPSVPSLPPEGLGADVQSAGCSEPRSRQEGTAPAPTPAGREPSPALGGPPGAEGGVPAPPPLCSQRVYGDVRAPEGQAAPPWP